MMSEPMGKIQEIFPVSTEDMFRLVTCEEGFSNPTIVSQHQQL